MQIKRPLCLVCGIFALLVLVAVRLSPPPAEPYTGLDREKVKITGVVTNKQLRSFSGGSTVLELTVHDLSDFSVRGFSGPCPLPSGVILQIADLHNEPAIGATITAEGSLRCYQHATNPGEFDAVEYYRIQRVDFAMRSGYILGNVPPRFGLRESMYQWRRCFEIILERAFPPEEAGILKAMLLGDKTSLSEDTRKLYQTSGILHVLAISGLHISILGLMLYRLLKRLYVPAFLAAPVCLTFILLFSMLIGGGISPTRAIFMFALKILGDVLGRTYDMLTAVTLALFLMLLEQPYYVGHAGFLLSFGAVLGISVLVPVLEDAFGKHRMLPSVAIFLATFPVLLRFYFTFSPYATLLNLLIIPLMNVVLIDGILVLAVGLITLSGGMAFMALPDRLILGIYEKACLIFQALPGSLQICGQPPLWKVILYYPGLLVLFLLFRKGKMPRMVLVQGILVLLMVFAVPISGPGVKVTGIDVGQGLSVLVQNDNGEAFLFDAGSTTKKDTGKYQIAPCLKALGVGKLKAVFLSHPDEDHINGMMQLLKEAENGGLRIGQIILPQADPQLLTGYEAIADAAKGLKIPVRVADKETTFSSGNLVFFCLNPVKDLYAADINEISQTWLLYKPAGRMERLRRKKKGTSILLTGDITGSAEEAMTRQLEVTMENLGITSINLLQVAHHGSAYSTTDAFLQVAEPKEALISCGIDNSYGHPHQELLERLQQRHIRILRTDRLGAVSWTP